MRIAIVNDMKMAVEVLKRIVLSVEGYELAWIAYDGREAVSKCSEDCPDLILMDLIMPVMNGVDATRKIMVESPCIILVVTASVDGNQSYVFNALGAGALDVVRTPSLGLDGQVEGAQALLDKIKRLGVLLRRSSPSLPRSTAAPVRESPSSELPYLTVIGSSTGGPNALRDLFNAIPSGVQMAFVVVQHIDEQFAPGLVEWLDHQVPLEVRLIKPGNKPTADTVLVASTNDHLVMHPDQSLDYSVDPLSYPFRPSADVLFNSVAEHWPQKGTAILLTGIGRDGANGMLTLHRQGWQTYAQDQDSCAVFGMPKAARDLNAVDAMLPPAAIGNALKTS